MILNIWYIYTFEYKYTQKTAHGSKMKINLNMQKSTRLFARYSWWQLDAWLFIQLTCELNVVCPSDSVFLVQLTGRECNNTAVLTNIREVEGVKVKGGWGSEWWLSPPPLVGDSGWQRVSSSERTSESEALTSHRRTTGSHHYFKDYKEQGLCI